MTTWTQVGVLDVFDAAVFAKGPIFDTDASARWVPEIVLATTWTVAGVVGVFDSNVFAKAPVFDTAQGLQNPWHAVT